MEKVNNIETIHINIEAYILYIVLIHNCNKTIVIDINLIKELHYKRFTYIRKLNKCFILFQQTQGTKY